MRKLRNGEMLGLGRTRSINSYYFDDEFIFIDEKIPLTGRFAEEGLKIEYEDFLDFFFWNKNGFVKQVLSKPFSWFFLITHHKKLFKDIFTESP